MRSFTSAIAILFLTHSPSAVLASCGNKGDCESCTSAGCLWWQDMEYCEDGCGMEGCGASVCPSDLDTCTDCLGGVHSDARGQYSWSPSSGAAGECVGSCMEAPADASCFPAKSSADPSGYDPEICEEISTCRPKTSCGDCLEDGACAWSEGSCYDSCMDFDVPADGSCFEGAEYGTSMCPYEPSQCESFRSNCRKCLKHNCAWSEGECWDDCSYIADAACYPGEDYGRSICPSEEGAGFLDTIKSLIA